jgi:hypothetical protein
VVPASAAPVPVQVVPAPETSAPSPAAAATGAPVVSSPPPATVPPGTIAPTHPAPPAPSKPAGPAASLERAEELFASGRFGSALAEARAVLAREPENPEARQLVDDAELELLVERTLKEARAALAAGDRDRALQSVERGLAAKPTDARLVALRRELTSG